MECNTSVKCDRSVECNTHVQGNMGENEIKTGGPNDDLPNSVSPSGLTQSYPKIHLRVERVENVERIEHELRTIQYPPL